MKCLWTLIIALSSVSCYGQDWNFTIEVRPTIVVTEPINRGPEYYVVMFTGDRCTYCKVAKDRHYPSLKKALPRSIIVNVDQDSQWTRPKVLRFRDGARTHNGIQSLPAFWLVKLENKETTILEEWSGLTDHNTILSRVPKAIQVKPKVVKLITNGIYNGRKGSSHCNRQSLINHLLNDGIHRGRSSLNQLESMTDFELDQLHEQHHKGR